MIKSISEALDELEAESQQQEWGSWRVVRQQPGQWYLVCRGDSGGFEYDVPLNECGTHEGRLRWINQIEAKSWATDEIIANLVRAMRTLVGLYTPETQTADVGADLDKRFAAVKYDDRQTDETDGTGESF